MSRNIFKIEETEFFHLKILLFALTVSWWIISKNRINFKNRHNQIRFIGGGRSIHYWGGGVRRSYFIHYFYLKMIYSLCNVQGLLLIVWYQSFTFFTTSKAFSAKIFQYSMKQGLHHTSMKKSIEIYVNAFVILV